VQKKSYILVADDNPNIRKTLKDILTEKGYNVKMVSNGFDLLSAVREQHPRILVLDLMMPEKDGLEVFSTVKSLAPDTRVIIYTGCERYRNSAYARNADKFIAKTEGPKVLLKVIEELS